MCGIVGVAGSLAKKEEDVFKELLIIDSVRGEDSTGAAFINRANETLIAKGVGDPYQLIESGNFMSGMRQANKCIIGHNRSATIGKVVRKNAHPFDFASVVGVHNGTLRNKYKLEKHMDFDTDSEALYYNINQFGVDKVVPDVDGAYTLVWYDKDGGSINFLRNKERPLFYVFSTDKKQLFWASELWMLMGVLWRRDVKCDKIQDLPIDQHLSFDIPAIGKEFDEPVVQEIKQSFFQQGTSTAGSKTTTSTDKTGTKQGKIIHLPSIKSSHDGLKGKATIIRPMHWTKDGQGAYVINALSHEYPMKRFKIYAHSEEECKAVMAVSRWNAVIGGHHSSSLNCYKINILSLSKVEEKAIIPTIHTFKKDHRNFMIDKEEFEKKYSTCCFCGTMMSFEEDWKALSNDSALCSSCASDKEIADYLPNITH